MLTSQPHRVFIGCFQVKVHHLLLQGTALGGYALIKKQLVLYLCNRRAFNGSGVSDKRIEIELLIVLENKNDISAGQFL